MPTRQLHFNGFEMNTPSHINHGLWVHPENRRHEYTDIDYWTDTARLLERGLFDALFLADVVGTYSTYKGSREPAVRNGLQIPNNDPLLLVPAMATVTRHLGFAVTFSTTYEPPFAHARRMSTLDHLTRGRVAWNVVTGYLPDAALNFGLDAQIGHDDRYAIAEEFLDVVYKLWEGSWDEDAVVLDRERRIYTDPAKVHEIGHRGRYFRVDGPHLSEPSPQRTPVIYQAGTSDQGKDFAARHAEGIFLASRDVAQVAADVADVRRRAEAQGRDPDTLKILIGLDVITATTEEEVAEKVATVNRLRSVEGHLAHFGGGSGIDLSGEDTDAYLQYSGGDHSRSFEAMWSQGPGRKKVGELVEHMSRAENDPFFVAGTPDRVADRIEEIADTTGIDGYNLVQFLSPGTFEDFIDLVVPELQRRGRYRTAYTETVLRERLLGPGRARLPQDHPAARYRGAFAEVGV
jgi:FMN-dependent oxidoreductase (nitrilotriacetate monooxygenase family)